MRRLLLMLALTAVLGLSACALRSARSSETASQPDASRPPVTAEAAPVPDVPAPEAPAIAQAAPEPRPATLPRTERAREHGRVWDRGDDEAREEAEEQAREEAEEARLALRSPADHAALKQKLPGGGEEEREEEERRERRTGEHPFDAPEQFDIADRLIRERIGGGPSYAPNFKTEAQEALGLINGQGTYIAPRNSGAAMSAQGITAIAEHGPGNVSGRTRAILPLPSDPANSWIVGSVGGGIWKTTNAGASWTLLTQDLASIAVSSLATSAADPTVIYAGTGEGFSNSDGFGGEGIFKSTDGGVTWSQLAATTRFNGFAYTNRLIVSPNSPDSVVAATNTGMWRSVDGGTTWTQTYTNGTYRALQVIADPTNWRIQYGSMHNASATGAGLGVIKSTDAGATWALSTTGMTGSTLRRMEIAIAPSLPTTLYAQVDVSGTSTRHYVSMNSGDTWRRMTGTASNVLNGQGWYNNSIAVDPVNPLHFYVGGLDFYDVLAVDTVKTMTKRTAWNAATTATNYVHADQHNVTVVPNGVGYRILNGSDGGVAYSDDGGVTWTKTSTGYNSSQPYGADKRSGADQFITGLQDNGTWVSPSGATAASSWTAVLGGDGFFNLWNRYDANKLMGAIQYNAFYRSVDGGVTWNSAQSGMTDVGSGKGLFISQLSKSVLEPDLVMAPGNTGIWRSADFGNTWRKATLSGQWYPITSRGFVIASPVDSRVAWASGAIAGTAICTTAPGCTVMRSTDGGLSFSPTTLNGLGAYSHFVSGLAAHPTDVNTAYVLFSAAGLPKIMQTTDAGASWSSLTGTFATSTTALSTNGFPNVATYDLLVMPYDPNVMWAATEVGLVVTSDGGATWARPAFSFPNVGIWSMRIVDDKVVVATHGRGVWTIQLSELATYAPTMSPGLSAAVQAPSGNLTLTYVRRAAYDSTRVMADGVLLKRFGANAAPTSDESTSFGIAVAAPRVDTVQVIGYKSGTAYYSAAQIVNLSPAAAPIVTAASDGSSTAPFTITGTFTSSTISGHSGPSLNTPHNYATNANHVLQYSTPVIVATTGATIVYDDIALVEPCNDGSSYCTGGGYYDYVTVEATKDGATWIPLTTYDARYDPAWEAAYTTAPAEVLYRTHSIDLLTVQAPAAHPSDGEALNPRFSRAAVPAFAAGDTILVRWRMASDGSVNGWGWTIDNIKIQENGVLPIELADFGGVWDGDRVRLSWRTVSETNNARFVVERATGAAAWQEVGSRTGAGTTATERTYALDDARVPFGAERVRYRLHQVDFDGTSSYSGVIEVALGAPTALALHDVFPNPIRGRAMLRYALPESRPVRIELFDVTGRRVALLVDEVQEAGRREATLDAGGLAAGTYVVRLTAGSETQTRTLSVMR